MVKGKKNEEKPKEAVGPTLTIDVQSFVRTRDSVVTGLATLQDAIQTLSSAYIKHTNACLGDHSTSQEIDSSLAKLGDNPLLLGDLQRAPSPARSVIADAPAEKKERKKRQHDPNAPKRPLTPFFLYMQTARPIITEDLGPETAKGAVSTEGTRRWKIMEEDDKQLWTNAYKENLRLYNARMHSYKSGNNPDAKDMTENEAAVYADEHNIGADTAADAQLVNEASATAVEADEDADGEPEKEPTPPPKTPKAKGSRKGKATPASAAPVPEPIVPQSASIVPPKAVEKEKKEEKSPDKKRKRASKKADEVVVEKEKEELQVETPKSGPKPRKKKAKAEA